jgi:uncharacterized phiE125 gp8 family phage protein
VALPTVAELKAYLRVEQAAEDTVITDLLSSALAWAESLIGRPIVAEARTFTAQVAYLFDGFATAFLLPVYPIAGTGTVVTDSFGTVVDAADYAVDRASGRLTAVDDFVFDEGPHVITATVGLSAHPSYATKYEPRVRALVMGLASILYHRRNPGAVSESESGSSVSYGGEGSTYAVGVPTHLQSIVNGLRIRRIT